jgi:glycogen debranching enzyme
MTGRLDFSMPRLPRRGPWPVGRPGDVDGDREWLVTNGLGGYAAGTACGVLTRRYHGLLVAALPPPTGRLVCVSSIRTTLLLPHGGVRLDHEPASRPSASQDVQSRFWLEGGLPVWRHEVHGVVIEKTIVMAHQRNTTCVLYRSPDLAPLSLLCHVTLDIRHPDEPPGDLRARLGLTDHFLEIGGADPMPAIRVSAHGGSVDYAFEPHEDLTIEMRHERDRGYPHLGRTSAAGPVRLETDREGLAALTVSIEAPGDIRDAKPAQIWRDERDRREDLLRRSVSVRDSFAAQLTLAADQFVIEPVGHEGRPPVDEPSAAGMRSIIAGYHWFTDWGRDTMISLEGLTLCTGREAEAREILRMFAGHVRDGLIPNLFPEGERTGLYHTADATLWFFHALDRYVTLTGDHGLLESLMPTLRQILAAHVRGTRFGIAVDPADGLLRQGAEGFQLTWMDAKVDGWVVTPRRGKAVEINALWHNALCLMRDWLHGFDPAAAAEADAMAARAREAFNRRFWNPDRRCLFDVVDAEGGSDASLRPNQILAISLRHPVLHTDRWPDVLRAVSVHLLTPVGLRTLAPEDPAFQPRYFGDLRTRDAAYHQGTVWPWLIGPYVDACLRVRPDDVRGAREVLEAFDLHLDDACAGTISEIFDATAPHLPRGCVAQAWSVAEVLRAWIATQAHPQADTQTEAWRAHS